MSAVPAVLSERDRQLVAESVGATLAGDRPASDDRFRSPSDAAFIRALAAEASAHLERAAAPAILSWAADVLPRFVLTSSFGAESAVLLHMLVTTGRDVPVVFLDTGYHFDETVDYRRALARRWHLTVLDVRPDLSPGQQDRVHGRDLFRTDPDACCAMRKTQPLRRALATADGWATGVRRAQTPQRAGTPVVEARLLDGRWVTKIAPLAAWSDADVRDYQRRHRLPAHPLTRLGYRSIGCAPCTTPAPVDGDPRAGRWSGTGKRECGLHLDGGGTPG